MSAGSLSRFSETEFGLQTATLVWEQLTDKNWFSRRDLRGLVRFVTSVASNGHPLPTVIEVAHWLQLLRLRSCIMLYLRNAQERDSTFGVQEVTTQTGPGWLWGFHPAGID